MRISSYQLLAAGSLFALLLGQTGCQTTAHNLSTGGITMESCHSCPDGDPCATYSSSCDPCFDGAAKRLAKSTLRELRSSTKCEFSDDYEYGFETAFDDIAEGGKGVLPPTPPSKYWKEKYRCPEGAAKVEEWYSGYHAGVQHAFAKGVQHCNYVRGRQDFIESTLGNGCSDVCMSGAGVTYRGDRCKPQIEYEICSQSTRCCRPSCQPTTSPGQCGPFGHSGPCGQNDQIAPTAPAANSNANPPAPSQQPTPAPVPPPAVQPGTPLQPVPAERPAEPTVGRPRLHQQLGYEYERNVTPQSIEPINGNQTTVNDPRFESGRPLSWGTPAAPSSQNANRIDSWLFR